MVNQEQDTAALNEAPERLLTVARGVLLLLLGGFLLFGLTMAWTTTTSKAFQGDEIEHTHAAYNVKTGLLLYKDFRQSHNPLLYYILGPAIDVEKPVESFLRVRYITASFFLLNVILCGYCAWRLSRGVGGLLAAGLALSHTTFLERGIEVRTDGPMSLCVTAALAVELSGLPRLKRYCLEALLLAMAFLLTNKACFACFAFGCLWLAEAVRHRRIALVAVPMMIWTAPQGIAVALMAAAGNLHEFIEMNITIASAELTRSADHADADMSWHLTKYFLEREGFKNLVFCLLAALAWVAALPSWFRRSSGEEAGGLAFPTFLAALLFVSLGLNPFAYPYLHVTVLPVFFILTAALVIRGLERLGLDPMSLKSLCAILILLAAVSLWSTPKLLAHHSPGLRPMAEILRELHRVTEPDDAVFDMMGLYFRPDAAHFYVMTVPTMSFYRLGHLPRIPDEFRRTEAVALIFNARFQRFSKDVKAFLGARFVRYDRGIFLLGNSLLEVEPGETITFEALKSKEFRYDGQGEILVDGESFQQGFLEKGFYEITRVARDGPDRLIMVTPPPVPSSPRPVLPVYDGY